MYPAAAPYTQSTFKKLLNGNGSALKSCDPFLQQRTFLFRLVFPIKRYENLTVDERSGFSEAYFPVLTLHNIV